MQKPIKYNNLLSSYLYWDEYKGDDELRSRADEFWGCDRLLALFKDAVNPIGLGEHGCVADAHAQTQQQPAEGTHGYAGLSYHEERDEVDEEDAGQQHITQLSAGRPHYWCVIEADEGDDDSGCGQDAQNGQEDRNDGPGRAPLQFDDGRGPTPCAVLQGPHVKWAHVTGELVQQELIAIA